MKYNAHARLTPIRIKTAAIRTVMIFMLKIRFWPALITCAATLIAIALGFWQRDRTHQKAALQKRLLQYQNAAPIPVTAAPRPLRDVAYHRVRAGAGCRSIRSIWITARIMINPAFMCSWRSRSITVLLMRWSTAAGCRVMQRSAPEFFRIRRPRAKLRSKALRVRQNLDIAPYQKETGLSLQPVVIWQTGNAKDGLIRDWPPATAGIERNLGYMVQWWGIAVAIALCGLYGAYRAAR